MSIAVQRASRHSIFTGLLLLLAFSPAWAEVTHAETAPVVFQSTDTPPFWAADLPQNGVGGAMLQLLSQAAGINYTIEFLPVKRFRESKSVYLVGTPDLLTGQHRRAIFPIGIFYSAIFSYKPSHDISRFQGLPELPGHSIGVLRGTLENRAYFEKHRISVEESDSVESLLRKLKKGRIDFCIMVEATGRHVIQEIFPQDQDNFSFRPLPGSERPLAIMIDIESPEGRAVAARYRKVLENVLRSRQYAEILKAYKGSTKDTEYRLEKLDRFIQAYTTTWDD